MNKSFNYTTHSLFAQINSAIFALLTCSYFLSANCSQQIADQVYKVSQMESNILIYLF